MLKVGQLVAYIKNRLKYKVLLNEFTEETVLLLIIEILDCASMGIYGAIYRSPANYPKTSLDLIDNALDRTINLNKLNVIMGDLKVDINKRNSITDQLQNMMDKHGLQMMIDFDTRIVCEKSTTIDHV